MSATRSVSFKHWGDFNAGAQSDEPIRHVSDISVAFFDIRPLKGDQAALLSIYRNSNYQYQSRNRNPPVAGVFVYGR
jgi:hypothetical protein